MKLAWRIVFLFLALVAGKALMAQNNLTYKQLIEEADLFLKAGDIGFARIDYDKAVKINPADEYPRMKLAEIDRKANTQHHNDSLFEISLVNAEKYFKAGNYNLAQLEYKKSLELRPESAFIKDRLATISASAAQITPAKIEIDPQSTKTENEKISTATTEKKSYPDQKETNNDKRITKPVIAERKQPASSTEVKKPVPEQLSSVSSPFQTAVNQAEEFLAAKDFENAVQRYQVAMALKPGDKTVKAKLTSTQTLLDKQKKDQKAYNDIILAAEKAVTQKNTQQAITYYEQAAVIKPDDIEVMNIIITLRDKWTVEQNLDKGFKEIIARADILLHDNNLAEAKKNYEQARTIKPEDKYTQEKLLEISKIEAITETENLKKYKETLILAESLLNQEDYQGAFQSYSKASALEPREEYPRQKMTALTKKLNELESQYKIAYNGFITEANKAYLAKNWDVAMDNYLNALKTKSTDTLSRNQISRIVSYLDKKLITTLTLASPSVLESKEVKLPFKAIDVTKRNNHFLLVRVKNSAAGTPRLYISYGKDAQQNGGIIFRNLLKGGQYIDYVIRIVNQDRWYRLDNNWITLSVEGGSLEIENIKICADS